MASAPRLEVLPAPPGCPEPLDADARLVRALGDDATRTDLAPLRATIELSPASSGYRAVVHLVDGDHETVREVSDASCELALDAAVTIVAVALLPVIEAEPIETPIDAPLPEPATASEDWSGFLRLSGHAHLGVLPGVVLGGEVAGGARLGALRLEAAVRGLPLASARFGASDLGAELALATVLLRALYVGTVLPWLELHVGGGVDGGAAIGRGVGLSVPRDTAAPWVAIEAAAGIAWVPLPELALLLEIEALVPVVRPVFVAGGLGTLSRPEPIAGGLRLGVELRVP